MKVLMINGGPHVDGCTAEVCKIIASELSMHDIESETVCIGNDVKGCCDCRVCRAVKSNLCELDDFAKGIALKIAECDGVIFGSPVYCGGITGQLKALLDRLCYSGIDLSGKGVGAFVVLRRSGSSAALKELSTLILNRGGVFVPSSSWSIIYGHRDPCQVYEDREGLCAIKNMGQNMAWLLKLLRDSKESHPMPERYVAEHLNMIR